ncbi:MAG: adenylosuccinate lyase [Phycisphaerales bacterium]|jgi:adenylosuccinate lyase|nr:adenylosuccinate lyase [Phycisphaeraceae bacterium]
MSDYDTYTSPLATRNASKQMLTLWSPRHKFNTWRRIWLAVAEAQHEMGLPVSKEQVEELRAVVNRPGGITDAEMKAAEKHERELRHDVMAHVHALGDSCPRAKGIIHLGMTSQDVVCNADLQILYDAQRLIELKLLRLVCDLADFAWTHRSLPTLGFTHYQPAQPVTVGRRSALWAHDAWLCFDLIGGTCVSMRMRGFKGATGTQASFLALCDGDGSRVDRLDGTAFVNFVSDKLLDRDFEIVGQTYPRVQDTVILANLASTASVLHKIATDVRLLCNRKEIEEPFEDKQIGSSAMPYKRNPMRCERICGLTRFVMNLVGNAYDTAATQWLERTLDDSSNRRLSLPEAFLALDGALDLMHNVASGLVVHEAMVRKNLMAELPFMATENILMACVKLGGDRQEYHEHIRAHAQAAGLRVKQEGHDNDLLERLKADKHFWSAARGGPLSAELDWDGVLDPMKYIGRSVEQTERFVREVVEPLREQYAEALKGLGGSEVRV